MSNSIQYRIDVLNVTPNKHFTPPYVLGQENLPLGVGTYVYLDNYKQWVRIISDARVVYRGATAMVSYVAELSEDPDA